MPAPRRTLLQGLSVVLLLACGVRTAQADDWLPVSADDLKLTAEPKAPAASAIYLYRQVDRDDTEQWESDYVRIKILSEEGRKYADVEIPFNKEQESIRGVRARTIRPDGSIVEFDGKTFEKPLVQATGVKLLATTFTLPDVQVGGIIEYRYRHSYDSRYIFNSRWILSGDLFTRYAKFSLNPYRQLSMRYAWPAGLPPDTPSPNNQTGKIRLEVHDIPAFLTEDFMPPENELKYRVEFIYETADLTLQKDPDVFWKKYAKKKFNAVDDFLDERRAMTEALGQIVDAQDTPQVKLRKIYDRTQQLRNLSFERHKSIQETDREKLKKVKNVADVWKLGYGHGEDITWLFLALVRAAGIEAYPVLVSTRETHFFNINAQDPNELDTNVVQVLLDGKELYLDPGVKYAPFGLLPWEETSVKGMRLEKSGGTWIHTPLAEAKESRTERRAKLRLTPSGALEGKLTITYTGQDALWRRHEERHEDDADRKQFLEDQVKADIPSGIDVDLTNKPDWDSSAPRLVAEFDLKIPGWAASAGKRSLLPVGIFGARQKNVFLHATRTYPLYFNFPHQEADDVSIDLGVSWKVVTLPKSHLEDKTALIYTASGEESVGGLHLNRELTVSALLVDKKYYPSLQRFFEAVRTGDEEQVVLTAIKPATTAVKPVAAH
jgi:Domain of Unknown Function with PDB structure (DUF3857)